MTETVVENATLLVGNGTKTLLYGVMQEEEDRVNALLPKWELVCSDVIESEVKDRRSFGVLIVCR
jgi:hypothetical protein